MRLREAPPISTAGGARVEFIDGLRGWAAVMVLLSHLWGQFARHVLPAAYDGPLMRLLSDGHLAVVIFFVLSGIALSMGFVRAGRAISLLRAIVARYVRLVVPILGVTLLVYVLLLLHVAGSPRAASLASSEILFGARMGHPATLAQALGFATFDVLFRYGLQPTFDWALWTMPLEFKGSLLVYGLIGAFAYLPRLGRPGRVAVAGMVCAGLFIAALPLGACFCLGYLMAEAVVTADAAPAWLGRAPRLVPVLTLLLAVTCDVTGRSYDAITAAWALAVVQAAAFWPPVRAFLSNGISRWLGRVSFPLYLVHVPVIGCCGFLFVGLVKGGMSAAAATHVTVAVATIAALVAARALLPMEDLAIAWSRAVNSSRPRIPVSLKPGAAD